MTQKNDASVSEEAVSEAEEVQAQEKGGEADAEEQPAEAAAETGAVVMESDADAAPASAGEDAEPESAGKDGEPSAAGEEVQKVEAPEMQAEAEVAAGDDGAQAAAEEPAVEDADGGEPAESGDGEDGDEEPKRVVRMLAVGQQVDGVVRRITDFGAFVDIGVGRDGLIHISELSLQRVGKVGDVLSPNQQVQPWIKKLDRKRNRISLTLIDPDTKTIRDLQVGEIVEGTVTRILPYGAFIDIGIGRDALLHVREMSNKYVEKPEDVVKVGENVEARVVELNRRRGRVDLSFKGLRDEPEDEPQAQEVTIDEEIEEIEDEFADVEVLSPMELAFKRAVEAEGAEIQVTKKQGKRQRRRDNRSIQDEIIARTLETARK